MPKWRGALLCAEAERRWMGKGCQCRRPTISLPRCVLGVQVSVSRRNELVEGLLVQGIDLDLLFPAVIRCGDYKGNGRLC